MHSNNTMCCIITLWKNGVSCTANIYLLVFLAKNGTKYKSDQIALIKDDKLIDICSYKYGPLIKERHISFAGAL